ncbi:alpha-glucan family phosphorylase [Candidatus Acetothermia bacterium]|nr:alpha-glucan family phosphorylase [Candidatus Acetothermia bacterium]MCI2427228.1 alpha-glucan family phosphorylase [Candidatus Acetothermia bacterium]
MDNRRPTVAYFCMEYGLHTDLKIYAGGLGILAGDYLKAAYEQGAPLVGIGILWRQGYTKQLINADGRPYDAYPCYKYDFLHDTGVTVTVDIRGRAVCAKVWLVDQFGNAPLYLLDTNVPENHDPWITGQLYGWFSEERIAQEMILGIGGLRALRALGLKVDIYHFNEGHAVFAGIELIREKIEAGMDFESAYTATRKEIVFTTHTPVKEGNEAHNHDLLQYMGAYNGLSRAQMELLGGDPFNMTVAGLHLSRIANGVSTLHTATTQRMWEAVDNRPPIIAITNGVHRKTWVDERISKAYAEGGDLWGAHMAAKEELIIDVERRSGQRLSSSALLIGFARRVVPYKRSDLIFRRPEIIDPLLREGKIQILFAGKAHPLDDAGKETITRLVKISRQYPQGVVFLEDYDMEIGRLLTRGCDLWLNNPRRPLEASGTSGMKAAMNGVLNLSILDGWWPEGCIHGKNGWQFGSDCEGSEQDLEDVASLYTVLLDEVLPTYYGRREEWIAMMRASIAMASEQFSAARMLNEYYTLMYGNYSGCPEHNFCHCESS